jgi:hypothetical protein
VTDRRIEMAGQDLRADLREPRALREDGARFLRRHDEADVRHRPDSLADGHFDL